MVALFFKDIRTEREPFAFRMSDIFESLWRVTERPLVLKLMPAFACFMVANVTLYVFVDNYLTSAFCYGAIGGSVAFLVIGIAVAVSGRSPCLHGLGDRTIAQLKTGLRNKLNTIS